MWEYPKRIRKALLELKMEAHEREIAEQLDRLWEKFQEWKEGKICAGELSVLIHEYDRGPSRRMFSLYNDLDSDLCVASAIAKGRIKPEEVLRRDSHWAVPLLWRSEFRNILTLYMRHEGMVVEQAKITMSKAERLLRDREYAVNSEAVLDFAQKTTLSAHYAEFVVLAEHFNTKVVTTDSKLLKELPV